MAKIIDDLIISKPFEEPKEHWHYIHETREWERLNGRRPSGYWKATQRNINDADDPGEFKELKLVNDIRPRVKKWREAGYTNCTGVTRKLLQHWNDKEQRECHFFFCQLEAIETAIWLTEASIHEKTGIDIQDDGSEWERLCLKLATGTGKTVVMAMIICWQALNKIANPRDTRFSKNILIIAPGITVEERLQVLKLKTSKDNYYQSFNIVDSDMWLELLNDAIVEIIHWHDLTLPDIKSPSIVKKGEMSSEAFFKKNLSKFGNAKNILIINDEAHHCHRPSFDEDENVKEEATIWITGIDRLHSARGVLKCYDLTATPFKPTGKQNQDEMLFSWIISDFGLNDAIECGLVKTPIIAVHDDSTIGSEMKSKLFHIYPEVKTDLNRKALKTEGLPDLVRNAVNILSADWLQLKEKWEQANPPAETPPVLIIICNRAETAARLEYSLSNGYFAISELQNKDCLLRIDQDAFDKIESTEISKKDLIITEREKFNTVGKKGELGENIHAVIGVNMLSEGWDTRTVTHILGLRAFTSQLLCEQVIGRGLRRISYEINQDGFLNPEYVTVFGVPFSLFPIQQNKSVTKTSKIPIKIYALSDRMEREIKWPNVDRVEVKLDYNLTIDMTKIDPLILSPDDSPTIVELAPVIDGKPKYDHITEIVLEKLAETTQFQKCIVQGAATLQKQLEQEWPGIAKDVLFQQIYKIILKFINSEKEINDSAKKLILWCPEDSCAKFKKIIIALNMNKIINHLRLAIRSSKENIPVLKLNIATPICSTSNLIAWYTTKEIKPTIKSQINRLIIDSGWEKIGLELDRDRNKNICAWVKNDRHVGFAIGYVFQGQTSRYYPDFIIKFTDNRFIILEIKGRIYEKDFSKCQAVEEWIKAVNADGNFGYWEFVFWNKTDNIYDHLKMPTN